MVMYTKWVIIDNDGSTVQEGDKFIEIQIPTTEKVSKS